MTLRPARTTWWVLDSMIQSRDPVSKKKPKWNNSKVVYALEWAASNLAACRQCLYSLKAMLSTSFRNGIWTLMHKRFQWHFLLDFLFRFPSWNANTCSLRGCKWPLVGFSSMVFFLLEHQEENNIKTLVRLLLWHSTALSQQRHTRHTREAVGGEGWLRERGNSLNFLLKLTWLNIYRKHTAHKQSTSSAHCNVMTNTSPWWGQSWPWALASEWLAVAGLLGVEGTGLEVSCSLPETTEAKTLT